MYLSSLVLLPSPDTTEVITIITQKRKGRSSIYKTIFHLHVCITYFCFIKYKNLSNWTLLFQLSSTFTTISYIPIEKRVPQNAQKPRRRVLSLRWGCRRYCCGYMKTVRRSESDGFLYRKAFTQSLYLGSPF